MILQGLLNAENLIKVYVSFVWNVKYVGEKCTFKCIFNLQAKQAHCKITSLPAAPQLCSVGHQSSAERSVGRSLERAGDRVVFIHFVSILLIAWKSSKKSVSTFPVQSSFTVTNPRESSRIVHPKQSWLDNLLHWNNEETSDFNYPVICCAFMAITSHCSIFKRCF